VQPVHEAINRIRQWFSHHRYDCGFSEEGLIQRILNNVVGFDLNPLAVMASRVNYLLVIRDLINTPVTSAPIRARRRVGSSVRTGPCRIGWSKSCGWPARQLWRMAMPSSRVYGRLQRALCQAADER
jgi:hypothetical protein